MAEPVTVVLPFRNAEATVAHAAKSAAGTLCTTVGDRRRFQRSLGAGASHDLRPGSFLDVDPKKIGRSARGAPVDDGFEISKPDLFLVVVVGSRGARDEVCEFLQARGFRHGEDLMCAA